MANDADAAKAAVAQAEDNVNQKQVELLAARQKAVAADIELAETNLRQAEVELRAAQEKLRTAEGS